MFVVSAEVFPFSILPSIKSPILYFSGISLNESEYFLISPQPSIRSYSGLGERLAEVLRAAS